MISNSASSSPTQDERVMAALSHVTAILPFMGMLAPIIIWVTQREKSKYVAFHALQALGYQLSMILAWLVGMACYMVSFIFIFLSAAFTTSSNTAQPFLMLPFIAPFAVFGIIIIGGLAFIVYGLVGAVLTFQGKSFRYILIGNWVERFLQPKADAAKN